MDLTTRVYGSTCHPPPVGSEPELDWYDTRLELYGRFVGPEARLRDITIEREGLFWALRQSTLFAQSPYRHLNPGHTP